MPELLLELLSEEIPARMQARAARELQQWVDQILRQKAIAFGKANSYVTPRRLVLVIQDVHPQQAILGEDKRGPRADAPEQAIKGFKNSLPKGAKVEKRETEKGEYYFALIEDKAEKTELLLPQILDDAIMLSTWPKSMRWADHNIRWVRPLHAILCLFGGKIVPVAYGPVKAADTTTGHPFMAPKPFKVENFKEYKTELENHYVILDPAERRKKIEAGAKELAKKEGLDLKDDPGLLDEVTGLVEWPVVLMGGIDKAFMELPPEVLTTVMRHHQKYFALLDKKGELAPRFIVVANTEASDEGKAIVAGNERVLKARLADAKFFWDQDRKRTLESRIDDLEDRVFHAKLGSVLDKVGRVAALAGKLAKFCGADPGDAERAAELAKADLSTEMVSELPELQGVMGRYYALQDGEAPDVAAAVAEHYSPKGPGDSCPSAPLSVAVALADKIDTLVGFWAIDEKPTGSKDPYALRRAALGVIRLVIENQLTLAVRMVIETGWKSYPDGDDITKLHEFQEDLRVFLFDRLKIHLRDKGVRHDLIDALFARGGEDDLLRITQKAEALGVFLKTDDGANLLVAYRRANNIVRIEQEKDGEDYSGRVDENLFSQNEERELWASLNDVEQANPSHPNMDQFGEVLTTLANLRKPVDRFFDEVTVNCDDLDLRKNRLRFLSKIESCLNQVADFSKIEGGER